VASRRVDRQADDGRLRVRAQPHGPAVRGKQAPGEEAALLVAQQSRRLAPAHTPGSRGRPKQPDRRGRDGAAGAPQYRQSRRLRRQVLCCAEALAGAAVPDAGAAVCCGGDQAQRGALLLSSTRRKGHRGHPARRLSRVVTQWQKHGKCGTRAHAPVSVCGEHGHAGTRRGLDEHDSVARRKRTHAAVGCPVRDVRAIPEQTGCQGWLSALSNKHRVRQSPWLTAAAHMTHQFGDDGSTTVS